MSGERTGLIRKSTIWLAFALQASCGGDAVQRGADTVATAAPALSPAVAAPAWSDTSQESGEGGASSGMRTLNAPPMALAAEEIDTVAGVPRIVQQQSRWCWAASFQMSISPSAVAYQGQRPEQCEQAAAALGVPSTRCCPRRADCNKGRQMDFARYNVTSVAVAGGAPLPLDVIKEETSAGRAVPFITRYKHGYVHAMVIYGWGVDGLGRAVLFVRDPSESAGPRRVLVYDEYVREYEHLGAYRRLRYGQNS